MAGLRGDAFRFSVEAGDPVNGGRAHAGIVTPKGGVAVGPWRGTEIYANAGQGFHSNDARGVTIVRDPATGSPADRATPLVRATGAETGLRTVAVPHLQSSVTLWTLDLASELVFVGDAGTTDAGRPSRRTGVEWTNYYSPRPGLVFDADLAWSRARFTDAAPIGAFIPGSVETVISSGVAFDGRTPLFGAVRLRYFGPRPLAEDGAVRSQATSLVSLQAGCKIGRRARIAVDIFNLFDDAASDIDYYYTSRLPGEPAGGVDDIHFHPTLPRTARVTLNVGF
jgi:hypothetical protein